MRPASRMQYWQRQGRKMLQGECNAGPSLCLAYTATEEGGRTCQSGVGARTGRAHDRRHPLVDVVAFRAGRTVAWRVEANLRKLLLDALCATAHVRARRHCLQGDKSTTWEATPTSIGNSLCGNRALCVWTLWPMKLARTSEQPCCLRGSPNDCASNKLERTASSCTLGKPDGRKVAEGPGLALPRGDRVISRRHILWRVVHCTWASWAQQTTSL